MDKYSEESGEIKENMEDTPKSNKTKTRGKNKKLRKEKEASSDEKDDDMDSDKKSEGQSDTTSESGSQSRSDDEDTTNKKSGKPSAPQQFSLEKCNELLVNRNMLEKWVDTDLFEESISGVFVRAYIGEDEKQNRKRFLLCQVESFKRSKEQGLGKKSCDIWLYLKHGTAIKIFPLSLISNGMLEQNEFQKFIMRINNDRIPAITGKDHARLSNQIKKANEHKITIKEIDKIAENNLNKAISTGKIDDLTMAKEMRRLSNCWIEALNNWETSNDPAHKKIADEAKQKLNRLKELQTVKLQKDQAEGDEKVPVADETKDEEEKKKVKLAAKQEREKKRQQESMYSSIDSRPKSMWMMDDTEELEEKKDQFDMKPEEEVQKQITLCEKEQMELKKFDSYLKYYETKREIPFINNTYKDNIQEIVAEKHNSDCERMTELSLENLINQ